MKKILLILFLCVSMNSAFADDLLDAKNLYDSVRAVCTGLSDELADVSGVAKGGTAIGVAGTAAAGGALAVGIVKSGLDKEIEVLVERMCAAGACDVDSLEKMSDSEFLKNVMGPMSDIYVAIERATERSKRLGNWRTGLMAGTIATNAASSILAGINADQTELIQHVQACNAAVNALVPYKNRLLASGVNPLQNPIVNKIDAVLTWCKPIDVADVEKIEKRMKAVMGVGIAGVAVGVAGTATSAAANSDRVRDNNTDEGKVKEKRLNTASNVLAGVNITTGAVETGVNVSLISLSKKLIRQAEQCEGAF